MVTAARRWPWYFLLLLAGGTLATLLAWTLGIWFPGTETFIRTTGGVLEILGIGIIAWGISDLRRHFGLKPTFSEMMADWVAFGRATHQRVLQALRRRAPKSIVTGTGHVTIDGFAVRARGRVGSSPEWTVDERIAHLERRLNGVEDALWKTEDDLGRETKQRIEAIAAERQTREADHRQLNDQLEELAVGGIRLETVGLFWLLGGVLLTTWSAEIEKAVF